MLTQQYVNLNRIRRLGSTTVSFCLTTNAEHVKDPSEDLSHPGINGANDGGKDTSSSAGDGDGGFLTGWRCQQRYRAVSIAGRVEERLLQRWGARGLGCHRTTEAGFMSSARQNRLSKDCETKDLRLDFLLSTNFADPRAGCVGKQHKCENFAAREPPPRHTPQPGSNQSAFCSAEPAAFY